MHDTSDGARGSTAPATTVLAVPGPALATVSVQVSVPPTVTVAGQDNAAEDWVAAKALAVLAGNGARAAAQIPAEADAAGLSGTQRTHLTAEVTPARRGAAVRSYLLSAPRLTVMLWARGLAAGAAPARGARGEAPGTLPVRRSPMQARRLRSDTQRWCPAQLVYGSGGIVFVRVTRSIRS